MPPYKKLISTKQLSHDEWLKFRQKGIGGSDASAVVGVNPYTSPFALYQDKTGLAEQKPDNEAMRQGRDCEEMVAKRFSEMTGKRIKRVNAVLASNEYPFMFANIDRWIVGENAGLECKTSKDIYQVRYRNNEFPEEYYCQCLHYIAVTGADKWYLAVMIYGTAFNIYEIERNENEINILVAAEKSFWENHVMPRIPPEPDGSESSSDTIKKMFPYHQTGKIISTNDSSKITKYLQLKEKIKAEQDALYDLENKIKFEMGEAEQLNTTDHMVLWRSHTKKKLDIDRLKKDHKEINIDDYYETSTVRRFSVQELRGV